MRRYLPFDLYGPEFGEPQDVWVASKTGGLKGVRCEAGLVHTPKADWALCVMAKDFGQSPAATHNAGTELISAASREVYQAWGAPAS